MGSEMCIRDRVVYVMRSLLAQAVERDSEARALQSELDEVI